MSNSFVTFVTSSQVADQRNKQPAIFINIKTTEALMKSTASNEEYKDIKSVKIGVKFVEYNHKLIHLQGAFLLILCLLEGRED